MKKRVTCVLLSAVLILCLLPGAALAVLCLVLYGASWLLSARWYETREL